jgi:hypothetical protein
VTWGAEETYQAVPASSSGPRPRQSAAGEAFRREKAPRLCDPTSGGFRPKSLSAIHNTSRMSDPILDIKKLTRRFGALIAVDAINLSVNAGEIFGLLAPMAPARRR